MLKKIASYLTFHEIERHVLWPIDVPELISDQGSQGSPVARAANYVMELVSEARKTVKPVRIPDRIKNASNNLTNFPEDSMNYTIDWSECTTSATSQTATAGGITRKTLADAIKVIRDFEESKFKLHASGLFLDPTGLTRFNAEFSQDFDNERHFSKMFKSVKLEVVLDDMYRRRNEDPYAAIKEGLSVIGFVDDRNGVFKFFSPGKEKQNYGYLLGGLSRAKTNISSLLALRDQKCNFALFESVYSLMYASGIYLTDQPQNLSFLGESYEVRFKQQPYTRTSQSERCMMLELDQFLNIFTCITRWCTLGIRLDRQDVHCFFLGKSGSCCNKSSIEREKEIILKTSNEAALMLENSNLRQRINEAEATIDKLKVTSLEKISAARLTGYKPKRKVTRLPVK
jgi:hypothetical protein